MVLLQQSQEALEFFEMFLTHDPTQPTKKVKISTQPNPTQPVGRPNPRTTLVAATTTTTTTTTTRAVND